MQGEGDKTYVMKATTVQMKRGISYSSSKLFSADDAKHTRNTKKGTKRFIRVNSREDKKDKPNKNEG